MGRLENLPENGEFGDSRAEDLLQTMANDLRSLQQDVVSQLHQDVQRLQAEKSRLISDIEKLQNQRQIIQSQHEMDLSRQQIAQQQAWAKQLALALANHLHTALTQRLSQSVGMQQMERTVDVSQLSMSQVDPENTQRLLASIDETVNRAFTSLNHDLSSYQSALSQQINRMHDLGQQGEAILEVLVGRISQQLQAEVLQNRGLDRPVDRFTEFSVNSPPTPVDRTVQTPPSPSIAPPNSPTPSVSSPEANIPGIPPVPPSAFAASPPTVPPTAVPPPDSIPPSAAVPPPTPSAAVPPPLTTDP
ncbi:hypothetical protein C7B76_28695, partial [filamentous cyanobacterium CCP2]